MQNIPLSPIQPAYIQINQEKEAPDSIKLSVLSYNVLAQCYTFDQ